MTASVCPFDVRPVNLLSRYPNERRREVIVSNSKNVERNEREKKKLCQIDHVEFNRKQATFQRNDFITEKAKRNTTKGPNKLYAIAAVGRAAFRFLFFSFLVWFMNDCYNRLIENEAELSGQFRRAE